MIITRIIVYCSTIGIFTTGFFCFLNIFVVAIIVVITMSQDLLFPNTCNRKDCQLYFYILINLIKVNQQYRKYFEYTWSSVESKLIDCRAKCIVLTQVTEISASYFMAVCNSNTV